MRTEQEQTEGEFAEHVMAENADLLQTLVTMAGRYVEEGRSDKLYLLTKAVILVLQTAQTRMKQTIGVDGCRLN